MHAECPGPAVHPFKDLFYHLVLLVLGLLWVVRSWVGVGFWLGFGSWVGAGS